MKKKIRILLMAAALTAAGLSAAGCASHKQATATAQHSRSRYIRTPIHEVTAEQLALDNRLVAAIIQRETGHAQEALTALAALTAEQPTMAAAWYEQGQLLLQRNWLDSAAHCLRHAATLQDSNTWYLLALAQCYQQRQEARPLQQTWERIVQLSPNNLDYYYSLSNAYLAGDDVEKAIEVLNRVEQRVGISEPVSLQKQRLWRALGKEDKALHEVEALADAMPQETRYQAILANSHMQRKQYAKAKRYYDRILQAKPDDEYIHIQLAEYYKQIGQPAQADSEMVQAFSNPRLDARTKLQLLGSFYTEEEFYSTRSEVCTRLLEMAMEQSSDASEYAVFYGDVLMRQQRYSEAAEQLIIGLQQDSSQYAIWEALLICLASDSTRDLQMYEYAVRAARLFPMHTLPLHLQGLHHIRAQRWAEAIEPLERAKKWGFNKGYLEAETFELLAEAYYRTAQYDRAWEAFEHAIQLAPNDYSTLNNYAYYLGEQGVQLEKALQYSRRTITAEPNNANSLDTYAWLLHLLQRDAEALPHMRKAVKLNPKSDTLRRHLKIIEDATR